MHKKTKELNDFILNLLAKSPIGLTFEQIAIYVVAELHDFADLTIKTRLRALQVRHLIRVETFACGTCQCKSSYFFISDEGREYLVQRAKVLDDFDLEEIKVD